MNKILILTIGALVFSCGRKQESKPANTEQEAILASSSEEKNPTEEASKPAWEALPDTAIVNLAEVAEGFAYDMRYATDNNFLETAVYSCANCKLRKEVAQALIEANRWFNKHGYRIKFYDCYRPVDVQKKMWEVLPDGRYVANPYRSGSIHNRGGAVDITLVKEDGSELEMGTGFDHFGEEAHHTYTDLPEAIRANRKLLKEGMEVAGFRALTTEWWHYLYGEKKRYSLANVELCDE